MLKFSARILSKKGAATISELLSGLELTRWTVERDVQRNKYFLRGYVDDESVGGEDFKKISGTCGDLGKLVISTVEPKDWAEAYKKSAKPWQYDCLHWIPTFMRGEVEVPEDAAAVYIEPGMAFGTGAHETTQLCGRALVMFKSLFEKTDDLIIKSCIDVGCGSGILGISAIKLGLVHATLIDIDEDAIRISQENAALNGIFPDQVDFVVGDVKIALLGRQADLLVNSVNQNGILCLSGFLTEKKCDVASVFGEFTKKRWGDSAMENSIEDGDWSALIYFRG
jgi:ribosomal protein L11 methyltransferase